MNIDHQSGDLNFLSIHLNTFIMKILSILCLILLLSGFMESCTPVAMTEDKDVPTILNTGDDDSVRPDNDRD